VRIERRFGRLERADVTLTASRFMGEEKTAFGRKGGNPIGT